MNKLVVVGIFAAVQHCDPQVAALLVAMVVYVLACVIYAWAMAPKANPREAEESAVWLQTT